MILDLTELLERLTRIEEKLDGMAGGAAPAGEPDDELDLDEEEPEPKKTTKKKVTKKKVAKKKAAAKKGPTFDEVKAAIKSVMDAYESTDDGKAAAFEILGQYEDKNGEAVRRVSAVLEKDWPALIEACQEHVDSD